MKKYLALVLAVLMALTCFALVACDKCKDGHTFEKGLCTVCGATDPNYDPNEGEEGGEEGGEQGGQQPSGPAAVDTTISDAALQLKNTGKIYLTSIGQANFSTLEGLFKNKNGLNMTAGTDYVADNALTAAQVTGNDILFIMVGGSAKGLGGSSGFTLEGEIARAQAFAAVEGLEIVVVHIGGVDYRGTTTDPLINATAGAAEVTLIVDGANEDGLFTNLCKSGTLYVYSGAARMMNSLKFLLNK